MTVFLKPDEITDSFLKTFCSSYFLDPCPLILLNEQVDGSSAAFNPQFSNQIHDGESLMKRQKRDRLGRAHNNGYQAGLAGKTKENCPYHSTETRSEWLGGWRAAVTDRSMGLFR